MIISLFKKGDREKEHNKLSESQTGFRFDRSCVDNIFILK